MGKPISIDHMLVYAAAHALTNMPDGAQHYAILAAAGLDHGFLFDLNRRRQTRKTNTVTRH